VRFDLDRAATRARGVQIFSPRIWNRCESQRQRGASRGGAHAQAAVDTAVEQAARTATGAWTDGPTCDLSRGGGTTCVLVPQSDAPRRPC